MNEKNAENGSFARWYLNPEWEDTLFPAKWDLSALPVRSAPSQEDTVDKPVTSRRYNPLDERKP